ncbi:MAG: hypothetical protein Q8Q14_14340 [Gemmatimonadales bacterium]|nr:hypothetical protein [Gemmatimonadales bacterium]
MQGIVEIPKPEGHLASIDEMRRFGRDLARHLNVPCVKLAVLRQRAPGAALRRWGLPNGRAPNMRTLISNRSAMLFVNDAHDGAARLVVVH